MITALMLLFAAEMAAPDLPADWSAVPWVEAQKQPRLENLDRIDSYIDRSCTVKRDGGKSSVTVHLAFLVDDKGKIQKVVAQDNDCESLEEKVAGTAGRSFRGVIQPAPAGTLAWYQTELEQSW